MIPMAEFEAPMLIREVAEKSGLPEEFVRAATFRGKGHHPLPCVRSGAKRPVKRIRWSTFVKWYEEEEAAE